MAKHGSRDGRRASAHGSSALALRPTAPGRGTETTLLLEIAPALHGDLAAVELAILVVAAFVGARNGASCLSRVAPAEIVKVPEGVGWEDEVPDWEGEEVDQHPEDVD